MSAAAAWPGGVLPAAFSAVALVALARYIVAIVRLRRAGAAWR